MLKKRRAFTSEKQEDKQSMQSLKTIKRLLPYMWPSDRPDLKRRVLWAIFFLLLSKIILVAVPYFFKFATNTLVGPNFLIDKGYTFFIAAILLILPYNIGRIVQVALNQLRDALFARVGQHAVRALAKETFIYIHRLSLRFHIERKIGGLSRIVERGTKGIEAIVRFTILSMIPAILEFIFSAFIFWFSYGWLYLCIILITVACYVIFTIKASNWRIAIRRALINSDSKANSHAVDSLLNFETVKYFGNEDSEAERFDQAMAGYEDAAIKTAVSLGWLNFGQTLIFGCGMAVLMTLSAFAVLKGQQTLGDFVFINSLLIQLSFPLNFIGSLYREIRQGLTDIEAMFNVLDVPQEVRDKVGAPALKIQKAVISFENISFCYHKDRPILKSVSFVVKEGKTTAIVGPSGAGKSTISRLLYRFYDPQEGRICIDGQDIKEVTQESLRQAIGIVPQDTVLFNDTIGYNIGYGRLTASFEEIQEAAKMAQIHDFIMSLPEGYQALVGERGLKLSGGEKQRVAIARTILKSPPILILDEATSALDSATEQDIQKALDIVSKNRTTLVIAHRLSTIVHADEILVLSAGQIIERGQHNDLLQKNGAYGAMWKRQKHANEIEEELRKIQKEET